MKHEIQPEAELWRQVVESNALDPSLVAEFRKTAEAKPWKPIGRILLEMKSLGPDQLMDLLALQAQEPTIRLGELAVREGYCTEAEIDDALAIQSASSPDAIELMLRDERIDSELMIQALVGYIHHLEGAVYNLRHERSRERAKTY